MEDIGSEISLYIMRGGFIENDPYILSSEENELLQRQHSVFQELTQEFPLQLGMDLSNTETEKASFERKVELTYGEVDFLALGELFFSLKSRHSMREGGVFYDLGSGTGKCVIGAGLLHSFEECIGIEILESLYRTSLELQEVFEKARDRPKIRFIKDDFTVQDWSNASLILVNGTCMNPEILSLLGNAPATPGTLCLSLTNCLPAQNWKTLEKVKKQMSWGTCTVFIQQRVDPVEEEELKLAFSRGLNSD